VRTNRSGTWLSSLLNIYYCRLKTHLTIKIICNRLFYFIFTLNTCPCEWKRCDSYYPLMRTNFYILSPFNIFSAHVYHRCFFFVFFSWLTAKWKWRMTFIVDLIAQHSVLIKILFNSFSLFIYIVLKRRNIHIILMIYWLE